MTLNLKFITADVIHAEDEKMYFTELCPSLSCFHSDALTRIQQIILMSKKSPNTLKLLQPPCEPKDANPSYYKIFGVQTIKNKLASSLIPKEETRAYLHKVFTKVRGSDASIWVTYYRAGINNTACFEFAILLGKVLKRIDSKAVVFEASPLGYACEQNKVLFWQLLKLYNSDLLIPKDIFRFSTFDEVQKNKLNQFLTAQPSCNKFIIKPIDSTLTQGMIIVERLKINRLIAVMCNVISLKADLEATCQLLKDILYPELDKTKPLVRKIVDATVKKFASYWLKVPGSFRVGNEYDFFLVEVYKEPKLETEPSVEREFAVASRCYLGVEGLAQGPVSGSLVWHPEGKRHFSLKKEDDPFGYVSKMSLAETSDTQELIRDHRALIGNYFNRQSKPYQDKLFAIFQSAKEQAWARALTTMSVSEFLAKITSLSKDNRELIAYLSAPSVTNLNLEHKEFCWHCFKIAEGLKQCVRCKQAFYCGQDCQKADWGAFHKHECKLLPVRMS